MPVPFIYSNLFKMYSIMAHVVRAANISPRMRRVTLGGEGLQPLVGQSLPADALKLYLPLPGEAALQPQFLSLPGFRTRYNVRPYTVRYFRPESLELDIDIFLHGDSPGSVWARTVSPGDAVGFIGPRHDYRPAPDAQWQLLAGDESSLPAIAAILESLPKDIRVHAFIEVTDASDELPLNTSANLTLTWLHRHATSAKDSQLLEHSIYNFAKPTGPGYAWVAGRAPVVKNIRQHLTTQWQLTKDQLFAMSYWR